MCSIVQKIQMRAPVYTFDLHLLHICNLHFVPRHMKRVVNTIEKMQLDVGNEPYLSQQ